MGNIPLSINHLLGICWVLYAVYHLLKISDGNAQVFIIIAELALGVVLLCL